MKRISKRTSVLLAVVAAAIVAAVGAYAYWTTLGSGVGSATTGTNAALTIVQTSTVSGLYPGGPSQPLEYTITNTAAFDQAVTTVSVAIASVVPAGCATSNFTLVQPTQSPGVIAAGATFNSTAGPSASGASLKLNETGVNQDICKNATVNLTYSSV